MINAKHLFALKSQKYGDNSTKHKRYEMWRLR